MFGSPSVTLFITFSDWQVNANQLEYINFLKSGPFSPEETYLRAISCLSNRLILFQLEIIKQLINPGLVFGNVPSDRRRPNQLLDIFTAAGVCIWP